MSKAVKDIEVHSLMRVEFSADQFLDLVGSETMCTLSQRVVELTMTIAVFHA